MQAPPITKIIVHNMFFYIYERLFFALFSSRIFPENFIMNLSIKLENLHLHCSQKGCIGKIACIMIKMEI
jgi:hypothetical protein